MHPWYKQVRWKPAPPGFQLRERERAGKRCAAFQRAFSRKAAADFRERSGPEAATEESTEAEEIPHVYEEMPAVDFRNQLEETLRNIQDI